MVNGPSNSQAGRNCRVLCKNDVVLEWTYPRMVGTATNLAQCRQVLGIVSGYLPCRGEPEVRSLVLLRGVRFRAVVHSNPSRCRDRSKLPVEQVNWFDAQDFCARLSETVGRHLRLPSEAEWECACRAGTTSRYSFGDVLSPSHANYDANI